MSTAASTGNQQLFPKASRAESVLPLSQLLAEEGTAAILHFAGPRKPWMPDYPEGPHRERYLRSVRMVTDRTT